MTKETIIQHYSSLSIRLFSRGYHTGKIEVLTHDESNNVVKKTVIIFFGSYGSYAQQVFRNTELFITILN